MLDVQKKSSFRIAEDSKFFTKLLSKESSAANPSFRVSGSVPFMWELRPGTPKHELSHAALLPPPLTPPPSYNRYTLNHRQRKFTRSNLFNAFIARISSRRIKNVASMSSSHSSPYLPSPSSGSSMILVGSPLKCQETSHRLDSEFDENGDAETPGEALCFRIVRGHRSRGCA